MHDLEPIRSQNRTEQSWLPDTSEKPAPSIDNEVTPSRCASIEWVHWPVRKTISRVGRLRVGAEHTCGEIENSNEFVLGASDQDRHGGVRGHTIDLCSRRAILGNVNSRLSMWIERGNIP